MQGCGTNPTCHLFRTYRQTDIGHRSQLIHLFNLNKKKSVFRPVSYFCIMMKHLGRIALTIQVVLMILMATATAMGKIHGTAFAKEHIFSSLAFVLLWIALAISSLSYLIIRKVNKHPAAFMLHLSFIVITIGALTTWSTGQYGKMQLTKEKNVSSFFENGTIENIPFSITLKNFKIQYYTGTNSPMDFICRIQIYDGQKTTEEQASMNHVIRHKGYRFGMSGYDENGTVTLSVTHDPFGIAITYAGFAVMLLAMASFFFDKKSRFHSLALKRNLSIAVLLLVCCTANATTKPQTLPRQIAAEFGDLLMEYNGRICPVQTFAKDFTIKLYGKPSYEGLSSEQVLTGWLFFPSSWEKQPMIKIDGKAPQQALKIQGKYAGLDDYYDSYGNYKLKDAMMRILAGDETESRKAFMAADEKYNLICSLLYDKALRFYPIADADNRVTWHSCADTLPLNTNDDVRLFVKKLQSYMGELAVKQDYATLSDVLSKLKRFQLENAGDSLPSQGVIKAEYIYNNLNHNRLIAIFGIVVAIMLFAFHCNSSAKGHPVAKAISITGLAWAIAMAAYLSLVILLRWIAGQHVPLSNGNEVMLFMAWCAVMSALIFRKRYFMVLPAGLLIAALAMMVATMGESNPQVTQLVPVLNSPLLSAHVTLLMLAYLLLAFVMLNGMAGIVLHYSGNDNDTQIARLQANSELLLYPAVFCLAAGIAIGAVWANVSWGTYWSWDPKEVWALITLMLYALPLHGDSLSVFRKPMFFHWFSVIAFLSVLFTYFGVNLLLGGLHGYA